MKKLLNFVSFVLVGFSASGAQAASFSYSCSGTEVGKPDNTIQFNIQVDASKVSSPGYYSGEIAPKYQPKNPKYANMLKYEGFGESARGTLFVEKELVSGGKKMKDGRMGGFIQWRVEAEGGFFQYNLACYK